MSNTPRPTSFRIPSKYIILLDCLADEYNSDRTKILVQILEMYMQSYLSSKQAPQNSRPVGKNQQPRTSSQQPGARSQNTSVQDSLAILDELFAGH